MAQKLIRGNVENLRWTVFLAGVPTDGNAGGSVASEWIQKGERNVSIDLRWTGTPAGTLTILLSNDGSATAQTLDASDFSPAMTNPAGSASNTCCQITTTFPFFKVNYASSSGTGTITGTATAMR